ncbi:GNAT family N-acetyltransferase [Ktedonospora formicarum]|uniref:Acetyltransferase n=1 Tax=Ktedonospora formicarum TaxID=2778364 RepID=A0A8J3ID72_9CHLR|nr:GNAT family N-acetyltransferase [Ktedonospora formicarum]GHO49939.1 acetyltransferase [Ktedonospora formicarum]
MNQQSVTGEITTEVTASDRANIARLIEDYRLYEGVDFLASLEEMVAPSGNKPALLLHYQGDTLSGFAYLQHLRPDSEIEVFGMVHPDHRRKGVGTTLFEAARAVWRRRGASGLLLVCDGALSSGKAFASANRGEYRFSEHRMVLDPAHIKCPQSSQGQQIQLRRAEATEVPILAHLVSQAFGASEEAIQIWVKEAIAADNQHFYIGLLDGLPIGTLRTVSFGEKIDIVTFGVLPSYRGQGYGRQMLLAIVDLLLEERWSDIALDVETKNAHALGLYESCGFRTIRTCDYYQVIEGDPAHL